MTSINFEGRVAIVTGGGNGLGRDYSLNLAKRGAKVVVNDLGTNGTGEGQSKEFADRVVEEIRAAGGQAVPSYDTVATREGGANIVKTAMDAYGRVDIVINNAGFLRNNRFEDMTDEEIDSLIGVHLKGAFHVTQPAYKVMKEQKYGRILFTSSSSGMFGHPWQTNYGAAKAAVVGLMHNVALEGQRHGILANALLPMAMTRLGEVMGQGWYEVTNVAEQAGRIDFNTLGARMPPSFCTPLVLYLVSEACKSTHGSYSAVAGRYSHVFIGDTDGWLSKEATPTSPEEVAARWSEICDRSVYGTPHSVYEEAQLVEGKLKR
ncbi:SDR family NAD(P)-dependent oxidoreductase [Hyalangium minutum]|uniref:3-oxoacyl-[acyl-carrier protein] reductase n=1 Tax=Hyalangium minutum TaxID=394096 RepID=A0A085WS10_9BACT|nr:SDR family NAD(P)-dependent oxidoreductase [Hyalangium minutum]KFE70473.1 3-oxoacyl-[acyl-carrier protein] reductase [Hyalangium minutum]